jgi:hypothetical protein
VREGIVVVVVLDGYPRLMCRLVRLHDNVEEALADRRVQPVQT